jgi:glycosyltransferase involved in cell wall biosynthesis
MQNMTKICNVTMHYSPVVGGQEIYIRNLNKILSKNNFNVSVLQRYTNHRTKSNTKIYFTSKIFRYLQFLLHPLIYNSGWFIFNFSLYFYRKILKAHDIILCHYPFHYPPINWHKKVLIISHGVLWSNKPKTLFDIYHKKVSKDLLNKNVFIVANDTHFLREIGYKIEPSTGFFTEVIKNVWFIPNCVDTDVFKKNDSITKEKIILVPRNIRLDRGIHLAIEAFSIFEKNNTDFKMLIVGSGSGKYYNFCLKLVSDHKLEEKIIFVKHANHDEMVNFYNRSLVTLIPSLEKEGTSLSALESMSCGCATVVTSVAGLLDLPAYKTKLDAGIIAEDLDYVVNNSIKIASDQEKAVLEGFNIGLWEKAWLEIINEIKNR